MLPMNFACWFFWGSNHGHLEYGMAWEYHGKSLFKDVLLKCPPKKETDVAGHGVGGAVIGQHIVLKSREGDQLRY